MRRPLTPALAADAIIEMPDRPGRPIVLIERKNPPYGWAIPGGFVELGETVEHAARREALEETGLIVRLQILLGVYSDPLRDNRGHTVTAIYVAEAEGQPVAADDAAAVDIFNLDVLPDVLAFDHAQVLADYWHYREQGALPAPVE